MERVRSARRSTCGTSARAVSVGWAKVTHRAGAGCTEFPAPTWIRLQRTRWRADGEAVMIGHHVRGRLDPLVNVDNQMRNGWWVVVSF
jgi:hypothetical protein